MKTQKSPQIAFGKGGSELISFAGMLVAAVVGQRIESFPFVFAGYCGQLAWVTGGASWRPAIIKTQFSKVQIIVNSFPAQEGEWNA